MKKIGVLLLICLTFTPFISEIPSESKHFYSLKEIHRNLFDFYLPDDPSLTSMQRLKRLFYREAIWFKLKGNSDITALLTPLYDLKQKLPSKALSHFEDILEVGFENVSPIRQDEFRQSLMQQDSIDIKKYFFKLRQTWLYITYSTPLTYDIANVKTKPQTVINSINLKLPKSRLKITNNEIMHQEGEIDYLIIGSGPAGSVIAHELTRHTHGRVVMIEAGSFVPPLSTVTESSSELMESHNTRRNISGGIILRNGETVGGGTTVNIDLAFSPLLPQIKAKLQNWIDDRRIPTSFFHEDKKDWQKLEKAYAWVTSHVLTRKVTRDEVNLNNQLLLDGDNFAKTYDLNSREPTGKASEILKVSATEAFILPALKGDKFKGHLSLIPDAKVTKINFQEGIATSLDIQFNEPLDKEFVAKDINQLGQNTSQIYTIKAKNIILSAGTLGSAALLLRSQIPNDNIGKGIIIHPSMGIIGRFKRTINVLDGLSASVYAPSPNGDYFFEAMAADPSFIALIHPGSGKDIIHTLQNYKHLGGFGIMLIDSVHHNNRVFIDPKTNQTEVDYTLANEDKQRLREGLKAAVKILFDQGAEEVFLPTAEILFENNKFSPFTTTDQAVKAVNQLQLTDSLNFISSAHMQGSNKMGKNPATSVVSPQFRVWSSLTNKEISNLYVCDSSIFPTSVGANPMQSIYAIAKLFVDQVLLESLT